MAEYLVAARNIAKDYPCQSGLGPLASDERSGLQKSLDDWLQGGNIKYLGFADDVRPHIRDADCVVLPSYREGTKALLEACAMGRPISLLTLPVAST